MRRLGAQLAQVQRRIALEFGRRRLPRLGTEPHTIGQTCILAEIAAVIAVGLCTYVVEIATRCVPNGVGDQACEFVGTYLSLVALSAIGVRLPRGLF